MFAFTVYTKTDTRRSEPDYGYREGCTWTVLLSGVLLVKDPNGNNVAAFAPGEWRKVEIGDP